MPVFLGGLFVARILLFIYIYFAPSRCDFASRIVRRVEARALRAREASDGTEKMAMRAWNLFLTIKVPNSWLRGCVCVVETPRWEEGGWSRGCEVAGGRRARCSSRALSRVGGRAGTLCGYKRVRRGWSGLVIGSGRVGAQREPPRTLTLASRVTILVARRERGRCTTYTLTHTRAEPSPRRG